MKVTWKGDASHVPACRLFGIIFAQGRPEDISMLAESEQRKLANNPHFEPADKEAEALRVSAPVPDGQAGEALAAAGKDPRPPMGERIRELTEKLEAAKKENAALSEENAALKARLENAGAAENDAKTGRNGANGGKSGGKGGSQKK